ncbi:MAG: TetR/AcrR family transcriptional regulator [Clostridiales bacterium]|nr:TetR/AcrR family transcriptional regulator [Clostridiales bacterium]
MATISEKKNEKRMKILESAFSLFTSKSFSETAIDEIVKTAGVAKGTFYLYFKNKYDLLDQIIIYKSTDLVKEAFYKLDEKSQKEDMSLYDKMIFFGDYILDYMTENKELTALIKKDLPGCFDEIIKSNDSYLKNSIEKLVIDLINIKNISEKEALKRLYVIVEMVGSVACTAILYNRPYPVEEIKPVLYSIIKDMIKGDAD